MKKLIAALLMIPTVSYAGFMDGNKLLQYLESRSDMENTHAWGYIIGIHDSFDEHICTGNGVSVKQVSDVVRKFLVENPAQRNIDASVLVLVALGTAFPCQTKKSKRS